MDQPTAWQLVVGLVAVLLLNLAFLLTLVLGTLLIYRAVFG